ncbi:DUF6801 domain-containing protein [Amycolatopsis keratiniphila]|uniref:DUF6801 domain-containing protein n=1 Tax=Amycolatopsis keratiniphila subsp. keratiniphila TaxID=227715 RepID=A0A1W2LZ97_9PSEU|nr:DUF6801 domain-containing protein [Amycolatopsis keratiniphila]ONF72522.1 hypothetical protein AVR91_0210020 [Amycolatopsis keratiniphila subsp. keratiniphila]
MTQQVRRTLGRLPVLAGVILLAGVHGALASSAATDPAAPATPLQGAAPARQTLANTCVFADPVGERPVPMDVQATLPKVVPTGKPLQIKDFSLTFTLAEGTLPGLTEVAGAATIELTAIREDKKSQVPIALEIPATKVPAAGELKLVAKGKVPDIVVNLPGELRITTGAPSLALTAVPASETPLKPITCTQVADQDTELGKVTLLKMAVAKPGPGKPGQRPGPTAKAQNAEDEREPIFVQPLLPFETQGVSSVSKLGAVVRLTPSFIFNAFWHVFMEPPHRFTGSTVMPPSKVTILGFGFVPINGTLELLPPDYKTGNNVIDVDGQLHGDTTTTATTRLEVYGKFKDVTVNGVALDVGSNCMTSEPIVLNLRGPNWDVSYGGVLRTDPNDPDPAYRGFTMPTFSGCGVKEDLDSLLSGMSSGPGNQACVGVNQVGLDWADVRKCPNAELPVGRR